ncbi:MAG: 23S rRNA (uracil(1939)-C(5))-methyltransferase RlmD [Oscillospiraceae bacterium]|nr:23S rRNA (uracil(1939)-C(5))-methyltransferase RlmD [Oscillospiraceae bacterium]
MEQLIKNQLHTADIETWSSDGSGVCHIGGRAVFVKGAIPGERWVIRIVRVGTSAVWARGMELLSPSPHRIEPDCPVYGRCGGCALRHVDYAAELEFKIQRVNDCYQRIGGLSLRAGEILGADEPDGYRNKAIYAIGSGPCCGFFRPRSHDVIPVERCRIQTEGSARAARALCDFMRAHNISAYDEGSGRGLVRHIFTRNGLRSGEMQITVVAAGGFGALTSPLVDALRCAVPEATGILLNVNKTRGNMVLSGSFYTLWGSPVMHDTLCGLEFELSPLSFYQVNPLQAEKLYAKALEFAALDGKGLVLDLYCGAGTISLCLAKGAERVIGAEIVPEAVENARRNAARNGIENVEFLCADAGQATAELAARGAAPDAVVLDPPRKGLNRQTIDAVCAMSPQRIIYVSCDPATQARDLSLFVQQGYAPQEAVCVDMFPRSWHVETVVQLSQQKPDDVIRVGLDLDELNITAAESKATYQEIKAYVKEKTGLSMSSLYIAQVKQKYGIIERENYNLSKSEDARQPQCPPEKEVAITEALRWFKMIE